MIPRVARPETRFAIGDRVRWRAMDPRWRAMDPRLFGGPQPWIYGRVRYVYEDGTVKIRSDAGQDNDRHPDFRPLELVGAVDQLAELLR